MFRILIKDEQSGQILTDQSADNYMVLSQSGNAFSKDGRPTDLITQLGLLHFALNQIQAEMGGKSIIIPVKVEKPAEEK